MPTLVRPAKATDAGQIHAIHTYYVLNTISTFALTPLTVDQTESNIQHIKERGLPYIVSTDSTAGQEVITGYAYLSPFRSVKGGYVHTVELSIYCHPEHLSRGLGTVLLDKLLDIVQHPTEYDSTWISENRQQGERVREIISCMSVDSERESDGQGLAKWYEKFGFERVGRLSRVGKKFDKWIDTIYLQRHIP